jgi:hypothetical protein
MQTQKEMFSMMMKMFAFMKSSMTIYGNLAGSEGKNHQMMLPSYK